MAARIAQVRQVEGAAASVTPPVPKSARIELTAACDLHCYFCACHKHPRPAAEMSPELYMKLARELRDAGVEQLGLFYVGESFLCEWLPDAIRYAKEACKYPYVFLTTNGVSATAERVRAALVAGLDSLKFALNWADHDQFHAIAGAPSRQFADVVQNLRAASWIRDDVRHETGHRCALSASSLCYDDAQRDRMKPLLAEIEPYVDEHYWLPLLAHWGGPEKQHPGRPVPIKALPCGTVFTQAHVTWDGRLSACSLDASPRFHMGDLANAPFLDAWHSESFQALRAAHLDRHTRGTPCQQCLAYDER